jgi:biotin-dependent carboxylase-like uncharacterized protein
MIEIIDPGPQTTVQDAGRFGHLREGIPPSGPMDPFAFLLANRLVGNADGAASLECTFSGPRLRVRAACALALAGADMPIRVNGDIAPGWSTIALRTDDEVRIGAARNGLRAYLAFSGGLDVPLRLGSRATYLRGKLGGMEGRALRKGNQLSLFPAALPGLQRVREAALPHYADAPSIRVVLGPQDDRFAPAGIATFLGSAYTLLPQSDRMGVRLTGNRIEHLRGHDIVSDGIAPGSVQVPGDGQPIVLMVDRQSTGGYTKIATACSFDLGRIAQLRPGQSLRFQAVTVEEAQRLLREWRALLASPLLEPAGTDPISIS